MVMKAFGREDADYSYLMAVSGWSGQFVYLHRPDWPTFIEPVPTIKRACNALGFSLEMKENDSSGEAFDYVLKNCLKDLPVISEYFEVGLFAGAEDGDDPKVQFFVVPFEKEGLWLNKKEFAEKWWKAPGDKRMFTIIL